jgi:preprotein translocase subunit SecF
MSDLKVIDFMGKRKIAGIFSAILIIVSIISLCVNGLQLGLDFTGGTLLEVEYSQPASLDVIRGQLTKGGYHNFSVVKYGADTDVLIRLQQNLTVDAAEQAKQGDILLSALKQDGAAVELKRMEYVGPQVGDELRDKGGLGILLAFFLIMVYVAFRFEFKFSAGAIVALFHDVIVTVGMFSIFKWDFDLNVLAAVLSIIGYSINDTIVIYDRIRENFYKIRRGTVIETINISITQTLDRTIATSLTVVLVLLALFFFGGEVLHTFSLALLIGCFSGTYSTVYIASAVVVALGAKREDMIGPEKTERGEVDDRP